MLRDLLARVALGMLGTAIAVSCTGEDKASDENLGSVQLALAGSAAGGTDAGGAPATDAGAPTVGNPAGGAGGEGGQAEPACTPQSCAPLGDCVFCNASTGKCENYKASDDHECRGATDLCDVAEFCGGGPVCPSDEVEDEDVPCGAAPNPSNLCDTQDVCDGDNKACPQVVRPTGTVCRPLKANSLCDVVETCQGGIDCPADGFKDSTIACDSKSDDCDAADNCPGDGPDCIDTKAADNTPCTSSNLCLDPASKRCQAGACTVGTPLPCQREPDQCEQPGICIPGTGLCVFAAKPNTADCDDGIACTEGDKCNGAKVCGHGTPNHTLCTPVPRPACGTFTCDPNANPNDFPDFCRMDPLPETTRCRASMGECGLEEFCDGATANCPADVHEAEGEPCAPATCVNFTAMPASACTGDSPVCPTQQAMSCAGYACDDLVDACRTTCAGDQDCDPGHYCLNGTCEQRIGAGDPCENDAQCSAGASHCVDGVCCDTACDNQCEACDVEGAEGICSPVTGEPHGDRPACAGDGSSCNGVCDGQVVSECDFPDAQTICQVAACDAGVAVEQAFCDGVGSCATTDPIECAPFVCGATACRGDCATDQQCAMDAFCKAGKCTPTQDPGQACTRDQQCASGFCTDGVCCEARCDQQCESCGAGGKCNATNGEPVGSRAACAGDDVCAGECDGQSRATCSYPGAAVVCREAACADGEATVAAQCSGSGACAPALTVSCPNGCEGTICAGDGCVISADCEDGQRCVAGTCAPQGEPGSACSSAEDCDSGFCVDGVCCDSACDGQCEACDSSGSPGRCTAIEGAPHGSRPACTSDGSACGGRCDGEDPNGCSYASGTVCSPGQCTPGQDGTEAVAVVEAQCNGSGRCPAPRQQACGGAGCDAAEQVCNGDCADGSACPGGQYCSAGICVATEPNGQSCQADQQCSSGHCVDGYCCSSACDDRCAACDVPGQLGQCSPVTGNTHGGRPGCQGGGACGAQCDGNNVTSCSFPDRDTSCGEPYCHDGAAVAASACDGAGQCRAGEQTACPAFACDGAECSDACESDVDCTGTLQCREGVCVEPFLINAVDEGTCGCRAPGSAPGRSGAGLLVVGLGLMALRRRRAVRAA